MRIKSYFAKTVDEAMAQAGAELGADAMLLSTRQIDGQLASCRRRTSRSPASDGRATPLTSAAEALLTGRTETDRAETAATFRRLESSGCGRITKSAHDAAPAGSARNRAELCGQVTIELRESASMRRWLVGGVDETGNATGAVAETISRAFGAAVRSPEMRMSMHGTRIGTFRFDEVFETIESEARWSRWSGPAARARPRSDEDRRRFTAGPDGVRLRMYTRSGCRLAGRMQLKLFAASRASIQRAHRPKSFSGLRTKSRGRKEIVLIDTPGCGACRRPRSRGY